MKSKGLLSKRGKSPRSEKVLKNSDHSSCFAGCRLVPVGYILSPMSSRNGTNNFQNCLCEILMQRAEDKAKASCEDVLMSPIAVFKS